jgi:outer membrane protein assembly factor BamB
MDLSQVPVRWSVPRGEGYSAPSIKDGRLIHHHRVGDQELVDCLDAKTGKLIWSVASPVVYGDRFNYSNGPRSSPAIKDERVFTLGVTGLLSCLDFSSGAVIWRRDLKGEFGVGTEFFGFACSPLVEDGRVLINLGFGQCAAAFDVTDGSTLWTSGDQWGRSYSSPIAATMHGRRIVFIFAGGESSPPVGGLLCLDPVNGKILDRFTWRSSKYASVNAQTPVVFGNRVFISSSYDIGGVMLEVQPDFTFKEVYRTKAYASHWATPILRDAYLYGFFNNKLVCMDWNTGERKWRTVPRLPMGAQEAKPSSGRGADRYRPPPGRSGFGMGSMIYVDGRFLVLGENGLLAWMELSPGGSSVVSYKRLFNAKQTWTAPVISDGCVYICQNLPDEESGGGRLICFNLKGVSDG